jgi:hypothetical protein
MMPQFISDCGCNTRGEGRFLRQRAIFFFVYLLAGFVHDFAKSIEQASFFVSQIRHD